MARVRSIDGLRGDQPYASVAARVVAVRVEELREHATGVLELDDVEPLHDMRVASRRLRAALEVFEPCFPPKRFKAALREVKSIADALGERRDRDVAIAVLCEFADAAGAADRPGIESLISSLRTEQLEANERLRIAVTTERLTELDELLSGLVAEAERVGSEATGVG